MRTGLDSAYPPSPAQVATALAAGYTSWSGYFSGPGILNGWSEQNFHDVMNGGMATSAYCSGWADAAAMKAQAASWGVPRIILDDESGIRSLINPQDPGMDEASVMKTYVSANRRIAHAMYPKGEARPVLSVVDGKLQVSSWVQPWLDAAVAGQYGNAPVFTGVHAACYVFAAYLGYDPGLSWPSYEIRPTDGPCGWQFQGTTSMFGKSVDLTHYDDGFWAAGPAPHSGGDDMLYVGPFHTLTASLKVFAAGAAYSDPSTSALSEINVAAGATESVVGYCFSNSDFPSSDRGGGAGPGPDYVWWKLASGYWVPDALLITVGVAGAPIGAALSTLPPGMASYFALAGTTGLTLAQVDQEIAAKTQGLVTGTQVQVAIATAVGALPTGLTKDQVDAEILKALGNLPVPPGTAHHHGVLGIINTGPVIPDPA